jgi:hypothetical protein
MMADRHSASEAAVGTLIIAGIVLGIIACVIVAIGLSPKRHVIFYRDEAMTQKVLDVLQDSKWQIIVVTYTVRDATGNVLARFRKNYLHNIIRKKWKIVGPDSDALICQAMEDSIILSLLRRFLGPMFGLLRTNFIICPGDSEQVIGEFNRKFTLFDRYVLDMTADPGRTLDRRIALALGVMLDTGERR